MANVSESDTPEKFLQDIENFENFTYKTVNFTIKAISSQLFENVIRDTPVRSGRAKNNWVFSSGTTATYKDVGPKKLTKKQRASGSSPFDKSGEGAIKAMENGLRRAPSMIKKKEFVLEYYLTNQVPYINRLEYGRPPYNAGPNVTNGRSSQAPGGMARKNVQKFSKYTLTQISKVRGKI
jgi:hypothetical protein